jgi:L-ribulokinase
MIKPPSKPCVIGIDFGTLSARAVLVDSRNGRELASAVCDYPHGVISQNLPGTKLRLKAQSALQDPGDYIFALKRTIAGVLRKSKIPANQIGGIGTDFTSCTVLPVSADGTPLCFKPAFAKNPHAWVKLWKHHATQPEADCINAAGRRRSEAFIETYGGKYSSEWFFAKVLETVREAPGVYKAAGAFVEACDWIVWQLTGSPSRNISAAGFKGMRVHPQGNDWACPECDFFSDIHPDLSNVVRDKLAGPILQLGARAGGLTAAIARELKLPEGIPVAAGNIDAHAGVPACGVTRAGTLVMIMGTSTCHLLSSETGEKVEGICGVVQDGIVPGLWGYEAGQAGVGDVLAWYVENAPAEIAFEAKKRKASVHDVLTSRAADVAPGSSGLLALDWWNGNRSILVDAELSGVLLGLTIHTRPEEIYRALIEATAFGTRKIIEAFEAKGVPIRDVAASGGLAQKNPLLMQIYSDVLQRPIRIGAAGQSSAFGAAMWGAVAGGLHRDIHAAARRMAKQSTKTYMPDKSNARIYDRLYAEYSRLHDFFGRDVNSPMKAVRAIAKETERRTALHPAK